MGVWCSLLALQHSNTECASLNIYFGTSKENYHDKKLKYKKPGGWRVLRLLPIWKIILLFSPDPDELCLNYILYSARQTRWFLNHFLLLCHLSPSPNLERSFYLAAKVVILWRCVLKNNAFLGVKMNPAMPGFGSGNKKKNNKKWRWNQTSLEVLLWLCNCVELLEKKNA